MTINMNDDSIVSITQLKAFIKLNQGVKFKSKDKVETYRWVNQTLIKFNYFKQKKKDRGIIKHYLITMTGYSKGGIDKLIVRKKQTGRVALRTRTQFKFPRRYTQTDIALLAAVCNAYQGQNGKAIKRVLVEMAEVYGDQRFKQLSQLLVSQLV